MRDETWVVDKEKILNDFAEAVRTKGYRKMIYNLWCNLKKYDKNDTWVITREIGKFRVKLSFGEEQFYTGDKSFGDYLRYVWKNPSLTAKVAEKETDGDLTTSTTTAGTWNFSPTTASTTWTVNTNTPYTYDYITTTTFPSNTICAGTSTIEEYVKKAVEDYEKNKEKKEKMNTSNMFNFDFGPVSGNQFRMSPYGLAIQTSNNGWIAYSKTGELINVDVINFDMSKLIYKMPVPLASIQSGDILIHAKKPVFVREINKDGTISVIDYTNASVSNILPVKSPFGFNFFTKVCALLDVDTIGANVENPFGSMLPFLVLSNSEGKGDIDTNMLLAMSMMNDGGMDFSKNPMMLYFLMNGKDSKNDMLPFLMMMSGNAWLGNGSPVKKTSDQ